MNICQRKNKKTTGLLLKIAILITAVWYLFYSGRLSINDLKTIITPSNIGYVVISILTYLIALFLSIVRLTMLLKTIELDVSIFECFKLTMIGLFFNTIVPGVAGGDIVKGYYLLKNEDTDRGRSSGIVIMDRLIGVIAMVFIALLCLSYILTMNVEQIAGYKRELSILFALLVLAVLITALAIRYMKHLQVKASIVLRAVVQIQYIYNMFDGFARSVQSRRILSIAFILSILIQILSLTGLLVFINTVPVQETVSIMSLAIVSSIVFMLSIIPVTPGNIGWTELMASFGWSIVGSNAGGVVFLYWRIINVLCSLPGGFIYLFTTHNGSTCRNREGI